VQPRTIIFLALGLMALVIPLIVKSNYWLYMLTILGIFMILVSSLDLLYGFTGLASLGHAAFFGIGAYCTALFQLKFGFPFLVSLIIGIFLTTLFSTLIGWPMLRIRGPYFALGTLAFGTIITIIIHNWDELTGGVSLSGIPLLPKVELLGLSIDFASKRSYYYIVIFSLFLTILIIRRLMDSKIGRAFESIRENQDLAVALGVNSLRYKLISFATASAIAAGAGGLYANYMGAIEPEIAGSHMSFNLLVMIVVGGPGTITGTIIGPLLLWFVPEFLEAAQAYRPLFFGLLLLLVIIFMPMGIAGRIRAIDPRIDRWIP